ncbi:MAG: HAMP domain-containing sensor histidine kinase [Candidatus Deferrimicrobium sp.]|nr:HAMP domain-containing sensor histidine kinase [Candidatus Deferrimicrobium sp.]
MGLLRRPLSIRAGVVLQLALVATASLTLLAVFALKVIEVTMQRRHVEAGISVAGVVRRAVEKEIAENPGSPNHSAGMFSGSLSPYINEVVLLPEAPPEGRPKVVPVGEKAFPFLPVYPTVDVILPFGPLSPPGTSAAASVPRGIRVRFHSPGIAAEVGTLVNVTLLLAAIDIAVLVLFGGVFLERTVISPVRKLASAAEKVAAGDYSLRVEGVEGNEVGQLAASFNRMVEGILEAQERLRRSEKETFRSEKLATVGRLAAGVAHEVGNPLMAIRGYAEHLLKHQPGAAESKECLDKVVEETKKIENIVRGLLSVASPGDGSGREGATDVNAVVRETVEMLSYRNLFRDVEVRLELGETPRAAILEDRFRQVLLNLVINAVDAMKGRGSVTVRTWVMEGWSPGQRSPLRRRASDPPEMDGTPLRAGEAGVGGGVAVAVTDTGGGIPAADLPLLFDPFFTTKEPGKGTGLGLSVSRTIVEGAGGEIRVESEEGKGATFLVVLPSARGTAGSGGEKGSHG